MTTETVTVMLSITCGVKLDHEFSNWVASYSGWQNGRLIKTSATASTRERALTEIVRRIEAAANAYNAGPLLETLPDGQVVKIAQVDAITRGW